MLVTNMFCISGSLFDQKARLLGRVDALFTLFLRYQKQSMSCEQAIVEKYIPSHNPYRTTRVNSIYECSSLCCSDGRCGLYTYISGGDTSSVCHHFSFPTMPYIPFPSTRNMTYTGNQKMITGILMKRKILTWIPFLVGLIVILYTVYLMSSRT